MPEAKFSGEIISRSSLNSTDYLELSSLLGSYLEKNMTYLDKDLPSIIKKQRQREAYESKVFINPKGNIILVFERYEKGPSWDNYKGRVKIILGSNTTQIEKVGKRISSLDERLAYFKISPKTSEITPIGDSKPT